MEWIGRMDWTDLTDLVGLGGYEGGVEGVIGRPIRAWGLMMRSSWGVAPGWYGLRRWRRAGGRNCR
jgi:hypothetical protein